MRQMVRLGRELAEVSNMLTNVYLTHDYYSKAREQYHGAIDAHIDRTGAVDDDFHRILKFRKVVTDNLVQHPPSSEMTIDTDSVQEDWEFITKTHKDLYKRYVFRTFQSDIKNMKDGLEKTLLSKCMKAIMSGSTSSFRDISITLDSYMGAYFDTGDLMKALVSYGSISGLIDWWTNENLRNI